MRGIFGHRPHFQIGCKGNTDSLPSPLRSPAITCSLGISGLRINRQETRLNIILPNIKVPAIGRASQPRHWSAKIETEIESPELLEDGLALLNQLQIVLDVRQLILPVADIIRPVDHLFGIKTVGEFSKLFPDIEGAC